MIIDNKFVINMIKLSITEEKSMQTQVKVFAPLPNVDAYLQTQAFVLVSFFSGQNVTSQILTLESCPVETN